MAFPNTVTRDMPWGIPGELALGVMGGLNAQPLILDAAENAVFGRALTHVADQSGHAVIGGAGTFAGILANPKEHVNYSMPGDADSVLVDGTVVSGVTATAGIWVLLTTAAAIGDGVAYATADGQLAAAPAQVAPADHTLIPGAKVVRYDVTGGLAIISLTELPNPAAAAE